jgi:hypothetical protein
VLGSIGVVATVEDTTERDAKTGKRTYEIVSSNAPTQAPERRDRSRDARSFKPLSTNSNRRSSHPSRSTAA